MDADKQAFEGLWRCRLKKSLDRDENGAFREYRKLLRRHEPEDIARAYSAFKDERSRYKDTSDEYAPSLSRWLSEYFNDYFDEDAGGKAEGGFDVSKGITSTHARMIPNMILGYRRADPSRKGKGSNDEDAGWVPLNPCDMPEYEDAGIIKRKAWEEVVDASTGETLCQLRVRRSDAV